MYEPEFHWHHLIPTIAGTRWYALHIERYKSVNIIRVPKDTHIALQKEADKLVEQAIEKEDRLMAELSDRYSNGELSIEAADGRERWIKANIIERLLLELLALKPKGSFTKSKLEAREAHNRYYYFKHHAS